MGDVNENKTVFISAVVNLEVLSVDVQYKKEQKCSNCLELEFVLRK